MVPEEGFGPYGDFDLTGMGLNFNIAPRGFAEACNPASSNITLKLYSPKNCTNFTKENSRITFDGSSSFSLTEALTEIQSKAEIREALWAMTVTLIHCRPYCRGAMNLFSFFFSKNFFEDELKASQVANLVDFLLGVNRSRWLAGSPPLSYAELEAETTAYKNKRIPGYKTQSQQLFQRRFDTDQRNGGNKKNFSFKQSTPSSTITSQVAPCANFNLNKCDQQKRNQCTRMTAKGRITRPHCCNKKTANGFCRQAHMALNH